MGEPTKWEKAKIAIEGIKLVKPILMAIRFLIALFAVYGGSMAYQMQPEIEAVKKTVDQAMIKINQPIKHKEHRPRLTQKDIQPIVDQAIATYEREHKIR